MVEKVFASVLGGMEMLSIALGDRLGFYALLAEGPLTADELAAKAGTGPRWTREWLEQQAVVGYLTVDGRALHARARGGRDAGAARGADHDGAGRPDDRRGRRRSGPGSPTRARTGAGLGWREYGPDMRRVAGRR